MIPSDERAESSGDERAKPAGSDRRRLVRRARAVVEGSLLPSKPDEAAAPDAGGEFLRRRYGGRSYRLFVPSGYAPDEPTPLVVMLHGCTQTPAEFAAETRMNDVAEAETFLVAYPKQLRRANLRKCWNWFDDAETSRGRGEVARIAGTAADVMTDYAIDDDRVYVAGLSAGGAMAAHAIVAYPDLFAAAGVHAGLGYDAADGTASALYRMKRGGSDPREGAAAAHATMGDRARPIPTIVFHGTDDGVVDVENGKQAGELAHWASRLATSDDGDRRDAGGGRGDSRGDGAAGRIDPRGDGTAGRADVREDGAAAPAGVRGDGGGTVEPDAVEVREVGPYTCERSEFHDDEGRVVVERWLVEGMGHAWSGGSPSGRYTAPAGPDASRETWRFFESHPMSELEGRPSTALDAADDALPWDVPTDGRLSEAWRTIRERVERKFG